MWPFRALKGRERERERERERRERIEEGEKGEERVCVWPNATAKTL